MSSSEPLGVLGVPVPGPARIVDGIPQIQPRRRGLSLTAGLALSYLLILVIMAIFAPRPLWQPLQAL